MFSSAEGPEHDPHQSLRQETIPVLRLIQRPVKPQRNGVGFYAVELTGRDIQTPLFDLSDLISRVTDAVLDEIRE